MEFTKWLQSRLVTHGAKIAVDGDLGRNTIAALEAFQKAKKLKLSGVADQATVAALRSSPEGVQFPPSLSEVAASMPPWMAEMHRKMGLHEVRDNASLIEWLKIGKYLGNPKDLPWCGDAIESCMAKTLPKEPLPSNPFFAQAWKDFGIDATAPVVGSIGVIRWTASSGHVGIVAGIDGDRINLLGGNQSNAINISSFPRSKFIAFRWPSTFPMQYYSALKGRAPTADLASTR